MGKVFVGEVGPLVSLIAAGTLGPNFSESSKLNACADGDPSKVQLSYVVD